MDVQESVFYNVAVEASLCKGWRTLQRATTGKNTEQLTMGYPGPIGMYIQYDPYTKTQETSRKGGRKDCKS